MINKRIFVNYAVFCNQAIAFVHSPGMKLHANKQERWMRGMNMSDIVKFIGNSKTTEY
ncbi:hypothetical protein [Nostoc sp.]|uniref:hypothetical protein n=1 Tax=Nostoc sp. TaxID=1180 RepID=UPI002FFADD19